MTRVRSKQYRSSADIYFYRCFGRLRSKTTRALLLFRLAGGELVCRVLFVRLFWFEWTRLRLVLGLLPGRALRVLSNQSVQSYLGNWLLLHCMVCIGRSLDGLKGPQLHSTATSSETMPRFSNSLYTARIDFPSAMSLVFTCRKNSYLITQYSFVWWTILERYLLFLDFRHLPLFCPYISKTPNVRPVTDRESFNHSWRIGTK